MDTNIKLSEALSSFRKRYPNVTTGDIQTFIIGWNYCFDYFDNINDCYVIVDSNNNIVGVTLDEQKAIDYIQHDNTIRYIKIKLF